MEIDKTYIASIYKKYLEHQNSHIKRLTNKANEYDNRIVDVMSSPYNKFITHHPAAGQIIQDYIIMHNGIKIKLDSYFPKLIMPMLIANKGVHEPEEEAYFSRVLKRIKRKNPVMVELGAYWGFYSLWFMKEQEGGTVHLIEPDLDRLDAGKINFILNDVEGYWTHAFMGTDGLKLDDYADTHKLDHIDILHSDIQGHEFDMLLDAKRLFESRKVSFAFISTHSNEIHRACCRYFENCDYKILFDIDMNHSSSYDGLIVASSQEFEIEW